MTIVELGAIGEFVAAILVLVTLVYLSLQVRQNTTAMRNSHSQHFVDANTAIVAPVVEDRGVAEIWVRGADEFASLDAIDRERAVFFEWRALSAWNHFFHMRKKGLVDDHLWHELVYVFEAIGRRQAMQEAWRTWRGAYPPEFQAFMDPYLAPGSDTALSE